MFVYIQGKEYLDYAVTGYKYSTEFLNRAQASEIRQDMGAPVKTGSHLDEISHEGRVTSPEALISKYFGQDAPQALKIASCESSMNPKAHNLHSSATGLFQIMTSVHGLTMEQAEDAETNIAFARYLYLKHGGWDRDWVECANKI